MQTFQAKGPAMLRRSLLVLLAGTAATLAHAEWYNGKAITGSGVMRTEPRAVGAFTGISLAIDALVEIAAGEQQSVVIEGDDNILPLIETVVENGNLKIRMKERNVSIRSATIKVVVNARSLNSLSIAGSGDIRAASLKSDSLSARIAGSGDIRIGSLDSGSLQVSISGSGDFTAAGRANTLETGIAGSGNLKVGNLETQRASIKISGSGNALVWAHETLSVRISGNGDVAYFGDPALTKSISGSGSIKRKGATPT
jgi:hypothetical protein